VQSLNLPGTLAAIGQIWIVESLPEGESKSGKRLWDELDDHCSAHPVNLRIGYLEAPSADVLIGYLDDLLLDIQASGRNAILHIECHGSDDATGLILGDGSYLGWDVLKPKLEAINIASRFNLILVLKGPKDPLDQASAGSISSRRAPQKRMAGYAVADATSVEGSRPATVSPRRTSFPVLRS
jgi:hypothetical protein